LTAKWLHETILGVVLFLVGMALFFKANQIPGDLGDSRFNMYVLEHGYRWLTGLDASFWSAPFFYPFTNDSLLEIGPKCEVPRDYLPVPAKGFSRVEFGKVIHVWAVDRVAELNLTENPGQQDEHVVSFDLATLKPRMVRVTGPDGGEQTISLVPGSPQHVEIRIRPGSRNAVSNFQTDAKGKRPQGESRTLFFDLQNPAEKAVRPSD
jgi:hypothetical protein